MNQHDAARRSSRWQRSHFTTKASLGWMSRSRSTVRSGKKVDTQVTSAIEERDQNNDGKLSRDELPAAVFDRLDADGVGFVNKEELRALRRTRQ
jgi:Ca2+-binding EF-hand superfamily protein